jgi:UDP:flavonoid glycosyltransferase YjiC (YdhE family)
MARILFTVTPAAGHLNPTIPIALALQARGHSVRYVTGLSKVPLLVRTGLAATPILAGRADTAEQISHPVGAERDTYNPVKIFDEVRFFLKLIQDGLVELEQLIAAWPPDLVVTDFATPIGVALSNRNRLRWVTTCTVPSCIRTADGTPIFLGGLSRPRHTGHRLRDQIGRHLHEGLRAGLARSLRPHWRRLQIELNLPGGGDGLYSPHAILGLAPYELEYPRRDWPQQLHWVGPVDWSEARPLDMAARAFLQSDAPKVFVTFGSEWFPPKARLLRTIAHTLDGMGVRTVLTGGGAVNLADLQFPNVHVIEYAPYAEILPHIDAIIHHGGCGITYSALQAGKPALIIPDGKDQPDNAQKVLEAGAGLRMSQHRVTPERVRTTVMKLLGERNLRYAAQAMAHSLARYRPVPHAVEVVEAVLENGALAARQ